MKYDHIAELENQYRVRVPYYIQGKRKYVSKNFHFDKHGGKQNALKKAKEFRDITLFKINQQIVEDHKKTLYDVLCMWDDQTIRSAETKKKHDGLVKNHILSQIRGEIAFTNIDSVMIQMSLNSAKNKSQNVIDRLYGVWQKIYAVAIKNRIVNRDLTVECDVPKSRKIVKKREQNFDISLFPTLLEELDKGDDGHLICVCLKLMYFTGIRPAEACAIERDAIDFQNCSISIYQSLGSDENNREIVIPTKTQESIRTVYFPEDFRDELGQYKQKFVFTRQNGMLLTTAFMNYFIKRNSSIEFRPYMLRHSAASRLLEHNVSLRALQEILGHSSPQMSQAYARAFESQKIEAMKKLW